MSMGIQNWIMDIHNCIHNWIVDIQYCRELCVFHELSMGIYNSVMDIPLEGIRSWPLISLCIYSISADTRRK